MQECDVPRLPLDFCDLVWLDVRESIGERLRFETLGFGGFENPRDDMMAAAGDRGSAVAFVDVGEEKERNERLFLRLESVMKV